MGFRHLYQAEKRQQIKQKGRNKGYSSLTDDALLGAVRASKDADTFDKLYHGEWHGKYPSQSEADFALCCKLAFWSNHDLAQMDRMFRASALFREKWDTQHGAGGDTYGQITIRNACEKTTDTYKPPKRKREISIYESGGTYFRTRGDEVKQLTKRLSLNHPCRDNPILLI